MRVLLLCALAACGRIGFDDARECSAVRRADAPYANSSEGADGLAEAFLICTAEQLDQISQHPEHWASGFRLAADLDLGGTAIGRIGDRTTPFTGAFDGGGHVIAHLTYDLPLEMDVGLFAVAATGARFTDLTLEGVDVRGANQVGALIGSGPGVMLERIAVTGVVVGGESVGGVIGEADCSGTACTTWLTDVTVAIDVTASNRGGGVIGYTYNEAPAVLTRLVSSGSVHGGGGLGGIAGDAELITLDASSSSADVDGTSTNGGLLGVTVYSSTEITGSSSSGAITCSQGVCGGVVGAHEGSITRTHATGPVVCGTDYCGGLAGSVGGNVVESFATGDVKGRDSTGALLGESYGQIVRDSFATGRVEGRDNVGGLLGRSENQATITRSYSSSVVVGSDNVGGLIGNSTQSLSTVVVSDMFFAGSVTGASAADHVAPLIGDFTGSVSTTGNLFSSPCTNTLGTCNGSGTSVASPSSFYSSANPPLTRWDFALVWQEMPASFPRHRP